MNLETIRHIYLRRGVATAFGALGLDTSQAVARWLARGASDLNTAGRQRAEAGLRAAMSPDLDDAAVATTITAMYDHIARFWTEVLFIKRLLRDSSWRRFVRVENEAALRALAESDRGCLLATAYFGNPAVAACALGRIFRPVHVIVDFLGQPRLRAWQRELYSHRWVRPIDWRDAARSVPNVLDRGGAVMMICDHHRPRGKTVPTRFLGRTLGCYPTLGRLAHWLHVPVGVVTCRREGDGGFAFTLGLHATLEHDAADTHSSDEHDDYRRPSDSARPGSTDDALVRRVMATLEQVITAHPEQYDWSLPVHAPAEPARAQRPAWPQHPAAGIVPKIRRPLSPEFAACSASSPHA